MNTSASSIVEVCRHETLRLHLPHSTDSKPTTTSLSILDATTAKFGLTGGVWFYQPVLDSAHSLDSDPLSTHRLQSSLKQTLSFHPWLAGQLHWAHSSTAPFAATSHDKRFRRLALTHGSSTDDPGAVLVNASCTSHHLSELIPPVQDRQASWTPTSTGWDIQDFLPDLTSLALHSFPVVDGPCFAVQITKLKCNGTAIGIVMSHQIADASTMSNFMHDWSRMNAAMVNGQDLPKLTPCFLPSLLDAKAAGDIDRPLPEQDILGRARSLPMLRYDQWIDQEGKIIESRLPPELRDSQRLLPHHGTPITWEDFDRAAPSTYRVIHFTPEEIENMYAAAVGADARNSHNQASSIAPPTRHDVLLAHLWQSINVARKPLLESEPNLDVLLTMTMGLRARLSLPHSFVGSPILATYISRPAKALTTHPDGDTTKNPSSLAQIARQVHHTYTHFTPSALADVLHDAAFEICPHRLWQNMIGRRHTLSTSWIHTHLYDDMDFGGATGGSADGGVPWYVHPAVSGADGVIIILEARPGVSATGADRWYWRGVDVGVGLRVEIMERLVDGDVLRSWR